MWALLSDAARTWQADLDEQLPGESDEEDLQSVTSTETRRGARQPCACGPTTLAPPHASGQGCCPPARAPPPLPHAATPRVAGSGARRTTGAS